MENQGLTQLQTSNTSIEKINFASQGLRVQDATEEQIKQVLRKIFVLLGLRELSIPNDLDKIVIIEYLRDNCSHSLEEIQLAFTLCLTGKYQHELNLFGEPFSIKYLTGVLKAYDQFKLTEKREAILKEKNSEIKMTNQQRTTAFMSLKNSKGEAVIDLLKDEIGKIGKGENKPLERMKLPFYDVHQKFMSLFDKLKWKYAVPKSGERFIRRYGKEYDLEGFVNYKVEQLHRVKKYLETRNQDVL